MMRTPPFRDLDPGHDHKKTLIRILMSVSKAFQENSWPSVSQLNGWSISLEFDHPRRRISEDSDTRDHTRSYANDGLTDI